MEFIINLRHDSGQVENMVASGHVKGDPMPTCMAINSTKQAKELGYVGIYKPGKPIVKPVRSNKRTLALPPLAED